MWMMVLNQGRFPTKIKGHVQIAINSLLNYLQTHTYHFNRSGPLKLPPVPHLRRSLMAAVLEPSTG
jgi:hypothetical protein